MIRITYIRDGKRKRVTIDGCTTGEAVGWMRLHKPDVHIFRASIMRRRRVQYPMTRNMVAVDETGTGAHVPVRRRP